MTTASPSSIASKIASVNRRHDNDYPLWQGPSGEGWNGGISQSMLVRFLSCRERFRLRYVLGLEPPDRWNHHTGYGDMWHVCEEALAESNSSDGDSKWEARLEGHAQRLCDRYPYQREEITKWYNVCMVQFPEYIEYWSDHPDVENRTPLMQEQVFDVPYTLPSGRVVRLRGKWDSVDLISDDQGNGVYLQENKTKGDVDKSQIERQLKFDLQTMMYLVAMDEARGVGSSDQIPAWTRNWDPICGVRYNVVRRPLSGGKGNIKPHCAKITKTKITPAETDEEFYERLRKDYLAADPGHWFFRVRAEISTKDIQMFRDTCLDPLLENLCDWYWQITGQSWRSDDLSHTTPLNYRTPFGVWSALEENGATEYDNCLETGSEVGLRRIKELFTELK